MKRLAAILLGLSLPVVLFSKNQPSAERVLEAQKAAAAEKAAADKAAVTDKAAVDKVADDKAPAAPSIPKVETKYVTVGKLLPIKISKNKGIEISIPVTVMPGHHIQSNPASNPQLIATRLELIGPMGVVIGEPVYPPGKPYRLQGATTEITTYDGTFEIKVPVTASSKSRAGEGRIAGKLRYQACNDKICFFPQSALVTIPVVVGP